MHRGRIYSAIQKTRRRHNDTVCVVEGAFIFASSQIIRLICSPSGRKHTSKRLISMQTGGLSSAAGLRGILPEDGERWTFLHLMQQKRRSWHRLDNTDITALYTEKQDNMQLFNTATETWWLELQPIIIIDYYYYYYYQFAVPLPVLLHRVGLSGTLQRKTKVASTW